MNFANLTGLTIPEGVVTQITDASGRVIWAVSGGKVILEVAKITADTYAGETTYTGEQFILLDIYPKTNGTVKVTYGGLTKTITDTSGAEEPNSQQVFFGTFNGVSDSVATPASGEVTIEGDCYGFGVGMYNAPGQYKATSEYCGCIIAVAEWGAVTHIPNSAFRTCGLTEVSIPESVTSIGEYAFYQCDNLMSVTFPESITQIPVYCFAFCNALSLSSLPSWITSIGASAFNYCPHMTISELPSALTYIGTSAFQSCYNITISKLPIGITEVLTDTFKSCRKITKMTFHSGVTKIEGFNLYNEDSTNPITTTFEFLGTTPPTLGSESSLQANNYTIIVPKGYGDVYKTASDIWSAKASKIVEAS